jgi:hypothetical protein
MILTKHIRWDDNKGDNTQYRVSTMPPSVIRKYKGEGGYSDVLSSMVVCTDICAAVYMSHVPLNEDNRDRNANTVKLRVDFGPIPIDRWIRKDSIDLWRFPITKLRPRSIEVLWLHYANWMWFWWISRSHTGSWRRFHTRAQRSDRVRLIIRESEGNQS